MINKTFLIEIKYKSLKAVFSLREKETVNR